MKQLFTQTKDKNFYKKSCTYAIQTKLGMTYYKLAFFIIFFISSPLFSNTTDEISVAVSYFNDYNGKLSIDDVQKNNEKFQNVDLSALNFGPHDGYLWIKLEVENTKNNYRNFVCEVENLLLNPKFFAKNLSDSSKFSEIDNIKNVSKHSHSLLFDLKSGEKKSIYIQLETNNFPVSVPIKIRSTEQYSNHHTYHTLLLGLVLGIMTIVVILSFIVWLVGRSSIAAYLFGFLSVCTIYFFLMDGLLFLFIGYEFMNQTVVVAKSMLPLAVGFLGLYINEFYEIKKVNPEKYGIFKIIGLSLILIFTVFAIFREYSDTLYILSYPVIALGITYNLVILLYAKIKYSNRVFWILLGLIVFSVFLILKFLFDFGMMPLNDFTTQFPKIGFAFLVTCITFSLAYRFRQRSNDLQSLNFKLDSLVKERTAEINNQNEELKTQTEELDAQREELETQKEELKAQTEELIAQTELLQKQNVELERLQLVASRTDNVIYIFNPDGSLVWFNSSFSSHLGLTYDEFLGKEQQIKIHQISSNNQIEQYMERCLSSLSSVSYESKLIDSKEQEHWYQTTLTPIFEEDVIKYIVAIDSDITKLKQYEEEVEHQRNLAINRKNELEYQQTEMMDSLRYAQRIQNAILPQSKDIKRFFPESFVLFEPKDIVSGDFYWFHRIGNKFVFIAVDCTGHGVPGAFMSIIGTYLLNNIIIQNNEIRPAEILKQLNRKLKISLKNESPIRQTNDGMDVSLVTIDMDTKKLLYAGALRPLFLCTQGDFIEVKGDKIPITSEIVGNVMAQFKEWEFDIAPGDRIYMFSDGLIDQFGGGENKKFLTKRFKQLILDAQSFPMAEQKRLIQEATIEWRGKNPQIDDILVLGVQI